MPRGSNTPLLCSAASLIPRCLQRGIYLDYLFLFRKDTYLICTLRGQEAPAAYADIVWEEETQRLVVDYENGMSQCYRWNGTEFILEAGE